MATLVITGPSAVGKTFLADVLQAEYGDFFDQGKLVTTRPPRRNDTATDREFADAGTFAALESMGAFAAVGSFNGNLYGYRNELFEPGQKHMVVNVWPEFLTEILKQADTIPLALTADPDDLPLLKARMKQRGDLDAAVESRTKQILHDIETVQKFRPDIESNGAVFLVRGDREIYESVIPWIIERFGITL